MPRSDVYAVLSILFGLFISATIHAQTLVLNDTNGPPFTTPDQTGFLDVVVGKAFRLAGAELRLIRTPAERGLRNANEGIDDGELTRIEGIDRVYTNLVRIPETIIDWEFVAFSKKPKLELNGWASLRNINLGYIRGWKIVENHTRDFPFTWAVRNADILFSMLEKDRIDVAVYSRWIGMAFIKDKGLKGIHVLEPALASRKMFIYLHRKHTALIPKITAGIRQIKSSGEYQRLFQEKVVGYVADQIDG